MGNASLNAVDSTHRSCIKILLGVRNSTPNNIVYLESGTVPLHCKILFLQLKYWMKISAFARENPDSYLSKAIDLGLRNNVPFIKYYTSLESKFSTPLDCFNYYKAEFENSCRNAFNQITDLNSPLGVYKTINITLNKPCFDTFEPDRILISKYRSGSHNLLIEKGRWSRIPRHERICNKCDSQEVQNLYHVLYRCESTRSIHTNHYSINDFFNSPDCAKILKIIDDIFI